MIFMGKSPQIKFSGEHLILYATYSTTDGLQSGECYTDGMHASGGCGVFIQGDNCAIKGTTMQACVDSFNASSKY